MIFSSAFLRELNFKATLLKKVEALRKTDNVKYSGLVDKYEAKYQRLNSLPVEKLKELVGEL